MSDALETLVEGFLKVPSKPEAPFGASGSVKVFRADRGFLYYRMLTWVFQKGMLFVSLVLGLIALHSMPQSDLPGGEFFWFLELGAVIVFLLLIPFSFLLVALDYRYRWYIITDRSLRIREGVWQVQERTMTFSNIQNLSIRQGPLQRLFSIADLEVRTAGGGDDAPTRQRSADVGENLHVGYFRGVANAEEIRDIVLERLRRLKASGLGDPDEPVADEVPLETPAAAPQVLLAAREVLEEVQALRRVQPL